MICEFCPSFPTLMIRSSIERNATSSSFLRLPYEIRSQIYRDVLGDRFIHLKHLRQSYQPNQPLLGKNLSYDACVYPTLNQELFQNRRRWLQLVCDKSGPRSEDEVSFIGIRGDNQSTRPIAEEELPPSTTGWQLNQYLHPEEWGDKEMHLGVLRTCHQLYNEANPILWSTNTFSFSSAPSCHQFFQGRNPQQKAAIQALHLVINIEQESMQIRWSTVLNKSLMRSLKNVSDLQLTIKDGVKIAQYRTRESEDVLFSEPRFVGILRLSTLPSLKVVRLSMSSNWKVNWTESDKADYEELSKLLRRRLLDGR